MPDFNDNALETQLRQFLYLGKEKPLYQPGDWFVHNYFTQKNIPSIAELAINPLKHDTVIATIIEAQNKNLVQNQETIVFALAACAQQNINNDLKRKAYDAVQAICTTPDKFILFNKFCSQLSKDGVPSTSGWGHGWKRAVKQWYSSKTPMELAEIVTKCKSRYGWKHKDIMTQAHLKLSEDEKKVVVNYVFNGIKGLKKLREEKGSELTEAELKVIEYIESVENFKQCQDEHRTAALIETLKLDLNTLPGHLLKSEQVWCSLIPSMNLTNVLKNLQRIHNMGFLKQNCLILSKVLDTMDECIVLNEKIHPIEIFIRIKDYENLGKPLSFEKRKVRERSKKPIPPLPEVNKKIVDSLNKLLYFSFKTLQPTNIRYMITLAFNEKMIENACWQCGNVNIVEAGCMLAMSLIRAEKDVTFAIFSENSVKTCEIEQHFTLNQVMRKLQPVTLDTDLSSPMCWAIEKKKNIDIFINIVPQILRKSDKSEEGIKNYRQKMNLPNAKLVNCAMCTSETYDKVQYDKNILTICGFDAKVPKVIEAFARSYF